INKKMGGGGACLHKKPKSIKNNLPQDFDIDMENPETERAAVAIQSQFRKFQKKKQGAKS
uniref:Purkinje cell protein 4 n=1 Tax=Mola mola TaxID=94237 RepID=A0A3Q3W0V9_MOLML